MGQTLYLLTVFVAGLVLGFVKSWKLTLVILAISPLVILSAAIMTKVRSLLPPHTGSIWLDKSIC